MTERTGKYLELSDRLLAMRRDKKEEKKVFDEMTKLFLEMNKAELEFVRRQIEKQSERRRAK